MLSASPRTRTGRATAAAGVALAAAAGGHGLVAGTPPSLIALLGGMAVLAGPAWWLTGRERGWPGLACAQIAGQLGAHALFGIGGGHHGWLPTDLMLLAHLLAAALAAGWLRGGERHAWALARRANAAVRGMLRTLLRHLDVTARSRRQRPAPLRSLPLRGAPLRHVIVLRGPPPHG